MLPQIKLPEHLSVSQLRTLTMCGFKWAYEHQEGTRSDNVGWDARLRGQCLDNAVSAHFVKKAENGVGFSKAYIKELVASEHERYQDATMFSINENLSKDRVVAQAALYLEVFGTMFTPRSKEDVQKSITYTDPDLDIPIMGIIDLIADIPMIVDTKIKGKLPKESEVHRDWQLTTYAMMTGIPQVALAVITDERTPRAELITSLRVPAQITAMKAIYNYAWGIIKARAFVPAAEGHWLCNSKWCNHWNYCPMGAGNDLDILSIPGLDE